MIDSFLNACGGTEPLQLGVRGPDSGADEVRILRQPFAIIGRDQRADIVLDHKLVSRRHVYLQLIEGDLCWVDLDSRSGTSSGGQLQKFGWLDQGKVIRIGGFEISRLPVPISSGDLGARISRPRPSPFVARAHSTGELPEITLEFLNGPSQATRWPMNRVMSLVGSADGTKFRLADPSVSPLHCSLLRTPAGLWVVDLLKMDGVAVNDETVGHALLSDGDVLRVGRYQIKIHSRFVRSSVVPGEFVDSGPNRLTRQVLSDRVASLPEVKETSHARPGMPGLRISPGSSTDLAWLTSGTNDSTCLEKGELSESVLVPLVNQFGMMQQQMLDQFQQAISMLVQMFGTLHQDQMRVIREELDQLRELTEELRTLKQDLAVRSRSYPGLFAQGRKPAQAVENARLFEDRNDRSAAPRPTPGLTQPQPASVEPVESASSPEAVADRRLDAGHRPDAVANGDPEQPAASPRTTRTAIPDPEQDPERDVVVWLHQRMMTLQRERESRWQKILKLLPGLS